MLCSYRLQRKKSIFPLRASTVSVIKGSLAFFLVYRRSLNREFNNLWEEGTQAMIINMEMRGAGRPKSLIRNRHSRWSCCRGCSQRALSALRASASLLSHCSERAAGVDTPCEPRARPPWCRPASRRVGDCWETPRHRSSPQACACF